MIAHVDILEPSKKEYSRTTSKTFDPDEQFKKGEETLDHLEQQLNEINHHKYANKTQAMLIHGSYLEIGIILSGTLLYFCHAKILAGLATPVSVHA